MSTTLPFKITTAGLAAAWNANYTGLSLDLTHVQLGSGNRTPDGTETVLVTPEQSVAIAAGFSVSPTQIRMSAIFAGNTGFNIKEIGIWAGAPGAGGSVLVAYWSQPSGTLAVKSPGIDFIFAHDMTLNGSVPSGSLTILADGAQSAMLTMITAHEAAADPHPQYLKATSYFPAGTRMMFAQAAAPAGWTQITDAALDNRMLRIVAGAGGGYSGSHSPILMNVVPSHTHGYSGTTGNENANHGHTFNVVSGGQSANHTHNYSGAFIDTFSDETVTGGVVGGTHVVKTSAVNNNLPSSTDVAIGDHSHNVAGTTAGVDANHGHAFSGTTDGGSSSTNWTPRYFDVIVAEKN